MQSVRRHTRLTALYLAGDEPAAPALQNALKGLFMTRRVQPVELWSGQDASEARLKALPEKRWTYGSRRAMGTGPVDA